MAEIMKMHQNYDYVLCASPITKNHYKEAFGIEEEKIKYIGMPRIDYILEKKDPSPIYKKYPELKSKTNILYVPTFRKGKKIKINPFIEAINTDQYNLIIKLHPLDHKNYQYKPKKGVILEDQFSSYDLLEIADKIITDYSSLSIEAALRNKPIYFYAYDLKEYQEDPGLNLDFSQEEIGKYMAKTPEELIKLIEEPYDFNRLETFKNKYITINTSHCTKQLAQNVLEIMNHEPKKEIEKEFNKTCQEELNI